ncbi:MAG: undecaprenyl-diphosphate phosphatase [Polyangiaceae bacterium]
MSPLESFLLGVLEGLTEFLPVSSTGHLILLGEVLGHDDDASKTLEIVIQAGAILAVVVYYRKLLANLIAGALRREASALRLVLALGIAFVPAAGLGFVAHKAIKNLLFKPVPIAIALIVGGVVMIGADRWVRARAPSAATNNLEDVTPRRALTVGLAQCFSLWPGMSRSMSTIVGGQVAGLETATAAEFSFLLSIPVLGAATLFDLLKNGRTLFASSGGGISLAIGLATAFIVSMAVIAGFLRYLKKWGLFPFGVYRILLGAVVLMLATMR